MAALGLIEVIGIVSAITTLDAMLKAAQVKRLSVEKVKGGLVAVLVTGDVGAVRAAVDAGLAVAQTLGTVVSHHVIPRPAEMTEWILAPTDPEPTKDKGHRDKLEKQEVQPEGQTPEAKKPETQKVSIEKLDVPELPKEKDVQTAPEPKSSSAVVKPQESSVVKKQKSKKVSMTPEELNAMKVVHLRNLARELDLTEMARQEIKFARKDELVEAILRHLGER